MPCYIWWSLLWHDYWRIIFFLFWYSLVCANFRAPRLISRDNLPNPTTFGCQGNLVGNFLSRWWSLWIESTTFWPFIKTLSYFFYKGTHDGYCGKVETKRLNVENNFNIIYIYCFVFLEMVIHIYVMVEFKVSFSSGGWPLRWKGTEIGQLFF